MSLRNYLKNLIHGTMEDGTDKENISGSHIVQYVALGLYNIIATIH